MTRIASFTAALGVGLCSIASIGSIANAIEIGAANKVVNQVQLISGQNTGNISVGTKIHNQETVVTGVNSTGVFLMIDDTNLAVGPNSSLVLDKFVFDPNPRKRKVVFTITKGALRFVTGSSPSRTYTIKTPSATIGVRGTKFDIYVSRNNDTIIALLEGKVRACKGGCRTISTPGNFLTITARGVMFITKSPPQQSRSKARFATAFPFIGGVQELDGKLATPEALKVQIMSRVGVVRGRPKNRRNPKIAPQGPRKRTNFGAGKPGGQGNVNDGPGSSGDRGGHGDY